MIFSTIEFDPSLMLCAVLISSTMMISFVLKLFGYKNLLTWLQKVFPWMNVWMRHTALISIMLLELTFSALVIAFGYMADNLLLLSAISLFMISLVTWSFFKKFGGCPCFGVLPHSKKFSGLSIHTVVLCSVVLLHLSGEFLNNMALCCAVLVAIVVSAFGFGRSLILSAFTGSTCRMTVIDELSASGIDGVDGDSILLLFFLKKRCPACVSLIAYVQKISVVFSEKIKFVLVIDGFAIGETVKFADAYIIPDAKNILRSRAEISSSPTIVAMRNGKLKKYVGLNACSQGMSDLIYSTL